jgi:hypothetical protein
MVREERVMRGAGFLAIWSDVERVNLTDVDRFFILYELETPEVLDGSAYLARLNAPTPWSQRIMPQLGNFVRGGGIVTARAGRGEGATIVALRIEHLPETPERLAGDIAALDGIAAVQIGATAAFLPSSPDSY